MRNAFKTTLIFLVLSSIMSLTAAQAVQCAPTDKAGSPLEGPGTNNGDGTVTCTYETARACTYFAPNGESESGSSECPAGIPQTLGGATSSAQQQQTSTVSATLSDSSVTAFTSTAFRSTSSVAVISSAQINTTASSTGGFSSTTTVAITSTVTPSASSSASGFVTLPSPSSDGATSATITTSSTQSSVPANKNSAASVICQRSVSSVAGIIVMVAVLYYV